MKTDGRVKYTKMRLRGALLELLKTKPINRVTVKEICQLAEVNRATFYSHYQDAFNLLEQIENELTEDILASLSESASSDIGRMLRDILSHLYRNAELCQVLFSEYGDKEFLRSVVYVGRESGVSQWKKLYPDAKEGSYEYLYTFIANGCVAVIEKWVTGGMSQSPMEMADVIRDFAQSATLALGYSSPRGGRLS